ncbi:hypothetical protein [uncultured Phenylobacterium sp.]|uniref:hypothetical protein n=1 Tax=uncultured Phenylobacterium sp. TaxID=349273 RepID=UPI0025D366FF|nr:hypothetical protein [uncultured Phenylobacterium sp.]
MDAEGRPQADLLVVVTESDGPAPDVAARTDAQGAFTFGLPDGEAELAAYREGQEVARGRFRMGADATPLVLICGEE